MAPQEPPMCANNCGFFGNPATSNLCSKCFLDSLKAAAAARVETPPLPEPTTAADAGAHSGVERAQETPKRPPRGATRCSTCRRKVGLMGFKCRCDRTFCGVHRYSDAHGCTFDYKELGKKRIAKENPIVRAEKIARI